MNRKIFAILTLLIVATSITAVSAFDLGDIFGGESKNQTVTISGIDFNIPEGFVEEPTNITNELADTIKQHGVNFNVKGYVKDFYSDRDKTISSSGIVPILLNMESYYSGWVENAGKTGNHRSGNRDRLRVPCAR